MSALVSQTGSFWVPFWGLETANEAKHQSDLCCARSRPVEVHSGRHRRGSEAHQGRGSGHQDPKANVRGFWTHFGHPGSSEPNTRSSWPRRPCDGCRSRSACGFDASFVRRRFINRGCAARASVNSSRSMYRRSDQPPDASSRWCGR